MVHSHKFVNTTQFLTKLRTSIQCTCMYSWNKFMEHKNYNFYRCQKPGALVVGRTKSVL
jgi:hypothetical protein